MKKIIKFFRFMPTSLALLLLIILMSIIIGVISSPFVTIATQRQEIAQLKKEKASLISWMCYMETPEYKQKMEIHGRMFRAMKARARGTEME